MSKPIKKDTLINIIAAVLSDTRSKGSITTRHSANELSCKGIRVLFAEDNPVNTKLMKILLKNLGCHFDAVPDGQAACNVLQKNHYDVVLMDVQMPIMNGLEATKIIQEEINNQIPIIALTAAALQEEKNKCYQSGMNDILLKPVSVEELKKKLHLWGNLKSDPSEFKPSHVR
jgi:CheY-like chemotaxis protein